MSLPRNLPTLVRDKYNAAKLSGDLIFSPTELRIIHANGIPVCLVLTPFSTAGDLMV
jgi:ATP adenylyltransferase